VNQERAKSECKHSCSSWLRSSDPQTNQVKSNPVQQPSSEQCQPPIVHIQLLTNNLIIHLRSREYILKDASSLMQFYSILHDANRVVLLDLYLFIFTNIVLCFCIAYSLTCITQPNCKGWIVASNAIKMGPFLQYIELHGYGVVGPFSSISATSIIRMTNIKNNWSIL
jgi:hypothetical protein